MKLIGPPAGVPSVRLFRSLLTVPFPIRPIPFRFVGVDHGPLQVRGLSLHDALEARDDGETAVVTRCLLDADGERVFADPSDMFELTDGEHAAVTRAVFAALDAVCPTPGRADSLAWRTALTQGARHSSNIALTTLLGESYEVAGGIAKPRIIDRPERYFGIPPRALTYGHLLCYRAARTINEESQHA